MSPAALKCLSVAEEGEKRISFPVSAKVKQSGKEVNAFAPGIEVKMENHQQQWERRTGCGRWSPPANQIMPRKLFNKTNNFSVCQTKLHGVELC